jgi:predicted kinase
LFGESGRISKEDIVNEIVQKDERELVILVGMQGAGKTHYCETALPEYERISQDEGPRTYQGVLLKLERLLREGAPRIVIDRTNPMRDQRRELAELARAAGYRVKIVYFDIPLKTCLERIPRRKTHPTLGTDRMHEAIAQYVSRLNIPTAEECDELITISS